MVDRSVESEGFGLVKVGDNSVVSRGRDDALVEDEHHRGNGCRWVKVRQKKIVEKRIEN
jgi:hypothetical protein